MKTNEDLIIDTILKYLPKASKDWELLGFINRDNEILPFGHDSKIIGRLFEVIVEQSLEKAAKELGFELCQSTTQTVYPDFYFLKQDKITKIAIDIKTTYREYAKTGSITKYKFTAGSFTSFMRNGTKNIVDCYNNYEKHYILGIVYTREENPTNQKVKLENISKMIPAYKDIEFFIQEKYRICGDKKGSGNTDNIGTISSNNIQSFIDGKGPFYFLGKEVFEHYWANYPTYKEGRENSKFTDLRTYIKWIEKEKGLEESELLEEKYQEYLSSL